MKTAVNIFITIIFGFVSNVSNAQHEGISPTIFKSSECIPFKRLETETIPVEKRLKYLKALYESNESDLCLNKNHGEDFKTFLKWHQKDVTIIDLDDDGVEELYFDGHICGGIELGDVEIFILQGDTLKKVFSEHGKTICLTKNSLTIFEYPCCASNLNLISNYSLKNFPNEIGLIGNPHLYFTAIIEDYTKFQKKKHGQPFIPTYLNKNDIFISSDSLTLRWTPNLTDYGIRRHAAGNDSTMNKIHKYSAGTRFRVLHNSKNSSWKFVSTEMNLEVESIDCFPGYMSYLKEKNQSIFNIYGWIEQSKAANSTSKTNAWKE